MRPVQVGEHVELPPCLPAHTLERFAEDGQDCPRVELDPENVTAASVVLLSLHKHTRDLVQPLLVAALAGDEDAVAYVDRCASVLLSPEILAQVYPPTKGRR